MLIFPPVCRGTAYGGGDGGCRIMALTSRRFLQGNLNHCARAQDLCLQTLAQWRIDLAVVAEPYAVPDRRGWHGDSGGSVAVVASAAAGSPPVDPVKRGRGYVAVRWDGFLVVGVYCSPNAPMQELETLLTDVGILTREGSPSPVLVIGDLNARSSAWGDKTTDARGILVWQWTISTGLIVANTGTSCTCVRRYGGSIVDVTLVTPSVWRSVRNWRVEETETLSDHKYIMFEVSRPSRGEESGGAAGSGPFPPRWAIRKMDPEVLREASVVWAWQQQPAGPIDVDDEAAWFTEAMSGICDAAMPRVRGPPPRRRQVYWWAPELAKRREECIAARRRYTRLRRRRNRDLQAEDSAYEAYTGLKRALQGAIRAAKDNSWRELLDSVNQDPWGRPYNLVRNKLRAGASPITETMDPATLEGIVASLFPDSDGGDPPSNERPSHRTRYAGVPEVSPEELENAVRKCGGTRKAPGPDSICGAAWAGAVGALGDRLRRLFTSCLEQGRFPRAWKKGRLVLLRKEGRPIESPSAYRPICVLDEAGKLLERILAARITQRLESVGPNLVEEQFGFRRG